MDGLQEFEAKASEVAAILKAVANERRLMLLCKLLDMGEANVGSWRSMHPPLVVGRIVSPGV